VTEPIRSPYDRALSGLSTARLHELWSELALRPVLARHVHHTGTDAADLFAELAVGTRLASEITAGRWCVVAELLQAGTVESWAQIGTALDVSETEARDGFHNWISGQLGLRGRTGTLGLTTEDADELYQLSEGVAW